MKSLIVTGLVFLSIVCYQLGQCGNPLLIDQSLLDAIREVESGGDDCAIGDRNLLNKAYGPFQIRKPYYIDAVQFNRQLTAGGRSFQDVWGEGSAPYSQEVIMSYMGRYATEARLGHPPTNEDIARIHNGGPNGFKNPSTEAYWGKVQMHLNKERKWQTGEKTCNFPCQQGECCDNTGCNCLNANLAVVPCSSLQTGKAQSMSPGGSFWLRILLAAACKFGSCT